MQLLNQNEEINKMDALKKHIYDENNELHYSLVGDYYIPDLKLPDEQYPKPGRGNHKQRIDLYLICIFKGQPITG